MDNPPHGPPATWQHGGVTSAPHASPLPSGSFPTTPDSADAVLDGLDPEQREVATTLHGPVCVLAGAGTGKTRAITHRIAYGVLAGVFQPATVLAVTFTQRAAGEMRGRLRQLGAGGVQARTFHSAALRQLQYFWPKAVGGEVPRVEERKIQLVAEAAARNRVRLERAELREVTGEIEWAKLTQTIPEEYPAALAKAGREVSADPAQISRIYGTYERLKRDRGVIDFEDVLLLTVGILTDRHDIAETVRRQYQHFVVDEYQDVSPLQQRLLQLWLGERDNLCVVGDASQTIYSFTGATPEHLLNFRLSHPEATVVKLVRDYRSTPQVVHLANGLLAQAKGRAAENRLELVSQRPAGPEPVFAEHPDEPAEAEATAKRIRQLLAPTEEGGGGVPASEIAVLFRINAQSEIYEQALSDAGIPYQVRGAERFFERPEIRQAGLALRGASRAAGNDPALTEAADEGLGAQVGAVLATTGWTPTPPAGSGAVRQRWDSLSSLVRLAEEFARARPGATLRDFVAELDERAAAQHIPTVEGVTLASLHTAKGLEWDAVFLVGLTDGMLPITHAKTPEQVEEERRLLYVGVTRARRDLTMSWALSRSPGGRASRRPSRFLDGLRPGSSVSAGAGAGGAGGVERGSGARGRRARGPVLCRVCGRTLTEAAEIKLRRCVDCPSTMDEELFERLREWRLVRARDLGRPPYAVFTDVTLMAIAENVPGSERELGKISGVGPHKLRQFGPDVLAMCAGQPLPEAAAETSEESPEK
ncbi:ATP-dependent DNA helicase UvrD2 [Streptomyces hainanensis]|uniref:DNA 3'-5' helicase n=1 Tax=Streptomyces hainanensis TaxID=402648 RepID=A0A4R4SN09_9ACTN|nr:ATP-dependent DNA helicase UvrD2 [Streptomyces hainanensis]TDC65141.1 ATP-dependent DNA helicase UvrD2 [Streptomyces hainanensis]